MNPVQVFEYGKSQNPTIVSNTFIGGVASTINSAEALAIRLGISSSNISNFKITGSNIEAKINVNYAIPGNAFQDNLDITYYKELNVGRCTDTGAQTFWGATNFKEVEFLGDCLINQSAFLNSGLKRALFYNSTTIHLFHPFGGSSPYLIYAPKLINQGNTPDKMFGGAKNIFIPKLIPIGATQTNGNHFGDCPQRVKIWADPSLQTSNGGAEEGDLAYARASKNAIIDYSLTSPDFFLTPINFSLNNIGENFGTAIKLVTNPSNANKQVLFKDILVNGVPYPDRGEGGLITGLALNTTYTISAFIIDEFYNISSTRTNIQVTTNSTEPYPISSLNNYYKLNDLGIEIVDYKKGENLTISGTGLLTQQTGFIDKSIAGTTTSSGLRSTTATPITGNFSITAMAYRTGTPTGGNSTFVETGSFSANGFGIWINSAGQLSWRVNGNFSHYQSASFLPLNVWKFVALTYDGAFMRIYIDNVLVIEDAYTGGYTPSAAINMFNRSSSTYLGRLESVGLWTESLTLTQLNNVKARQETAKYLI